MKSLQSHIRNPFIALIAGILLVTMVLFNIVTRLYLNNSVKQDLREAKGMLSELLSAQGDAEPTQKALAALLYRFHQSLVFSKTKDEINLLLFDKSGTLLFPARSDLSDLPRSLARISAARLANMRDTRVYSFYRAGSRYFALPWRLSSGDMLLVMTPAIKANQIIRSVDFIMLLVLVCGITAAIFAGNAAAKRIVRPVIALCDQMREVGEGRFAQPQIPARTEIREIAYLEQSAALMSERLLAYDIAQKTFLANASHELKTPLMSIQGYAEGIAGGIMPDTAKAASVILRESRRLSDLVSGLLTLSRMDTAKGRELQRMNLNQTLMEYEQRLYGAAAKQNRRLTLRLPEEEISIAGDDELLYQAVMNVVSNGLRYAIEEVVIVLSRVDKNAIIRISDDGDGIPPEVLPYLFERFYKGKGGNFGLGLAIAAAAVAAMQGSIVAENDDGAVFSIMLPLM